jgi:DNA-binding transcriptional LysR family regulator
METFVRVIDTGAGSAAARLLHVGQRAVSNTVAQLEQQLGVRLLLRSTHGLTPTEAGRNYYERARRALEEAEEAELAARGAGAALTGRLRICAAVTFARLHVIPRLPRFLHQHPALDVDIVLDDRNIDLIEQGIDLALRMGRLADNSLTARKIGESPRLVVATPDYLARAGRPQSPGELSDHQAVVHELGQGDTPWIFQRDGAHVSISVHGRLRTNAAEGVREGVLAGLGLAISSAWMFAPELASGAVVPVLTEWSLPTVDLWTVFPSGRQMSAKARAFAQFIEMELAGEKAGEGGHTTTA